MSIVDSLKSLSPWISGHADQLLYLVPSLLLAVVFRALARHHPVFFSFYLSGTILHELAHFFAGVMTNARPVHFSVLPRRAANNQWVLGSVSFANIRWYNAVFVGLAPVLILLVPVLLAVSRAQSGHSYGWWDAGMALLIAPVFLSFCPSRADLLIALRSWPYFVALGCWLWWTSF